MSGASPAKPPAPRRRPQRVEAGAAAHASVFWRWLAAAPAIVALVSSLTIAAVIVTQSPGEVLHWYQTVAERAMRNRDYQLAVVCYQRLLSDEPEDPANEFGFALSLAGVGRQREAIELLARLTPDQGPGYVPARLFVAQQLLDFKSPTSETRARAERNLLRVLEIEPMNETAHARLAAIYAEEEKWDLCRYHLERCGALRREVEGRILPLMPPRPAAAN